jgi:hypothetical protein
LNVEGIGMVNPRFISQIQISGLKPKNRVSTFNPGMNAGAMARFCLDLGLPNVGLAQ